MVKGEQSIFGSNGCLTDMAAATFGRTRIGPIQMESFTNGGKNTGMLISLEGSQEYTRKS
jgi:hypothetical protein